MLGRLRSEASAFRHEVQRGFRLVRRDLLDEIHSAFGPTDCFDRRISRQFLWLLGIQLASFAINLAAILFVSYRRG